MTTLPPTQPTPIQKRRSTGASKPSTKCFSDGTMWLGTPSRLHRPPSISETASHVSPTKPTNRLHDVIHLLVRQFRINRQGKDSPRHVFRNGEIAKAVSERRVDSLKVQWAGIVNDGRD